MSAILTDKLYENLTPVLTKLERDKDGNLVKEMRDISTRAKHRAYMKEKGLALADDFKETWAKAADERADIAKGKHDDKAVREALAAAAYKVFDSPGRQRRPKRPNADREGYPVVDKHLPFNAMEGESRLLAIDERRTGFAPELPPQEHTVSTTIRSRPTTEAYREGFERTFQHEPDVFERAFNVLPIDPRDVPLEAPPRKVREHDCERCGKHMEYDDQSCACSARTLW